MDERRARVVQLREAGLSYQAIADELGLSSAHHAVVDASRALAGQRVELSEDGVLKFVLEASRLDALERGAQSVLRQAAATGDHLTVLKAIDRLLRISARRSKLLGLDGLLAGPAGPSADELVRKRRERRKTAGYA